MRVAADSDATPYLSKNEVTRSRITLVGFAVESLFTVSAASWTSYNWIEVPLPP